MSLALGLSLMGPTHCVLLDHPFVEHGGEEIRQGSFHVPPARGSQTSTAVRNNGS